MSMKMMTREELKLLFSEQWSNSACCGYVVEACKGLGYNKSQIKELLGELKYVFDTTSVDEAKEIFEKNY